MVDVCPYGPLTACADCRQPMHRNVVCPDGHQRHRGRGLDTACYDQHYYGGSLDLFPRATYSRGELMEEWAAMSEMGVSFFEFPARVGMTFDGWYQAFYRARRAGHPLAVRTDR